MPRATWWPGLPEGGTVTEPSPAVVHALEDRGGFQRRHLGVGPSDRAAMLATLGFERLDQLIDAAVPRKIRDDAPLDLPEATPEHEVLAELREIAARNTPATPMIGLGHHGTITPAVLRRNVLEDPGWYTAYTPYQPEISQGRLEALLTFQTMVDRPHRHGAGWRVAAGRGDRGRGGGGAVPPGVPQAARHRRRPEVVLVDHACHPQTIAVVVARAQPLGAEVVLADLRAAARHLGAAAGQDDGHGHGATAPRWPWTGWPRRCCSHPTPTACSTTTGT
jgi:glycine dehydrogenase